MGDAQLNGNGMCRNESSQAGKCLMSQCFACLPDELLIELLITLDRYRTKAAACYEP